MIDCHVHSNFSIDGEVNPERFCETAIKHKLDGIIFTDHLDYGIPGYDTDTAFDFTLYTKTIGNLADKFAKDIKVYKGIEIGLQPHVFDKISKVLQMHSFDYVLASIHAVAGQDPYNEKYYEGKSKQQAYDSYLIEILSMINNFRDIDAVGHIGYVTRCAKYKDRSLRYADHPDLMDSIFKELIPSGKGFEINTGSYRGGSDECPVPAYDIQVLKRYKELGGEIICLGSDAHSPDYLGFRFEYFISMLKEAGFKYIAHFDKRKPVFNVI